MARFRGRFDYTIDAKGRFNIPAKFRKSLSPEADETFVVVRGPHRCLRAYPQDEWQKVEDELQSRGERPETLELKRRLYRDITDTSLDAQGRIMLTQRHKDIAGITREIICIGMGPYLELWSPQYHDDYFGENDDFDDVFFESEAARTKQGG